MTEFNDLVVRMDGLEEALRVEKKQHSRMLRRLDDLENQSPKEILVELVSQFISVVDNNGGEVKFNVAKKEA